MHPSAIAHDGIDALALVPAEHAVTAKAAVGARDDLNFGPDRAQALCRQYQLAQASWAWIRVAGTQIGGQHLMTAKHLKQQKTMVVILAVHETPDLWR